MREDQDQNEETEIDKNSALFSLAQSLLKKREEAIAFRAASGIERIWRESEALYDGLDSINDRQDVVDYATGEAQIRTKEQRRSRVIVNIIRPKCEVAEGRMSDILFPTDSRNWGLKLTPAPEMSKALKDVRQASVQGQPVANDDGSPVTMSEVAKSDKQALAEKMEAMETVIDDQLTECDYNAMSRRVIRSSIKMGTGIQKGPNVVKEVKKKWIEEDGIYQMAVVEEKKPASKWCDPWNVYPAPNTEEDIKQAAYIWERSTVQPKDLVKLIGVDGYFSDQIIKILKEKPVKTASKLNTERDKTTYETVDTLDRWDYHGTLNKEDLESLDVDVSHDSVSTVFSACAVFVNDRLIKVDVNPLDSGDLPYDFYQWTQRTGSPWGIGIPQIGKWSQRIITAALRAMMDNAGDSAGANIVISRSLEPADGTYEITGKKLWTLDESELDDVRKSFAQFQITNNQADLQAIIDLGFKLIDMETALPMLFQGEKAEAPETLGATNIMVDANNVALRSRVKLFDDAITRPHITRYYDWNMQYNERMDIKGEFNVDVRGTSVLFERDRQSQTIMQLFASKQDPDVAMLIDWEKATRRMLIGMGIGDVMKTDEDYAAAKQQQAQQQAPSDPRIAAAQIRVEGDMQKAQLVQQSDMAEIRAKAEDAEIERQHDRAMKEMEMNMKMMELSQAQGIGLDKIKSELARDGMKLKAQLYLADKHGKAEQVAEPPTEPVGRAPEGQAYQK
jgi:hypothetical protein